MKALIFKYRGLIWGVFAAALLVFPVTFSAPRMFVAVPLLVYGQFLRFWAAGIIPKYRTLTLDAPKLVTDGPYAWVRNPLYAGNALIGCSWSVMAGPLWLPVFLSLFLAIYCFVIIPSEEDFLRSRFGSDYEEYLKSTPSLVPRLSRKHKRAAGSEAGFDRKKSWFMERHSLRMNVLVTALILLRMFVLKY